MVTEKKIQSRIAEMLTEQGFHVVASEVDEGFIKPAIFINVYPASISLEFSAMEHVIDTVELKYIPSSETTEECADTAQVIRGIFMYKPFVVDDRKLTIQSIEFNIDKYILYSYFDVDYYQATPEDENEVYEDVEILEIGGNI